MRPFDDDRSRPTPADGGKQRKLFLNATAELVDALTEHFLQLLHRLHLAGVFLLQPRHFFLEPPFLLGRVLLGLLQLIGEVFLLVDEFGPERAHLRVELSQSVPFHFRGESLVDEPLAFLGIEESVSACRSVCITSIVPYTCVSRLNPPYDLLGRIGLHPFGAVRMP